MNAIKSTTIYAEYIELIEIVPEDTQKEILFAIKEYVFNDHIPKMSKEAQAIFNNLKRPIDKSKNKSKNATKQNQNENKSKSNQNQNEIESEHTSNDVNVNVNNYDNNYVVNVDVDVTIYDYLELEYKRQLAPSEIKLLQDWQKVYSDEVIIHAIKISVLNDAKTLSYVNTILTNWNTAQLKTLEKIKKYQEKRKKQGKKSNVELFDELIERGEV